MLKRPVGGKKDENELKKAKVRDVLAVVSAGQQEPAAKVDESQGGSIREAKEVADEEVQDAGGPDEVGAPREMRKARAADLLASGGLPSRPTPPTLQEEEPTIPPGQPLPPRRKLIRRSLPA